MEEYADTPEGAKKRFSGGNQSSVYYMGDDEGMDSIVDIQINTNMEKKSRDMNRRR